MAIVVTQWPASDCSVDPSAKSEVAAKTHFEPSLFSFFWHRLARRACTHLAQCTVPCLGYLADMIRTETISVNYKDQLILSPLLAPIEYYVLNLNL